MTLTDHLTGASAWLASQAMRTASDALLGGLLLIAGSIAVWDSRNVPIWNVERLDTGFFPIVVGALTVAVGILLVCRAVFVGRQQPVPWRLWGVGLVIAGVVLVISGVWQQPNWMLFFGPPEYAALYLLALVAAIVSARWSRLQAVGMTLLGLLLGAVGIDVITGTLRMTMGLEQLVDGISPLLVALGLIAVADAIVCLLSPSLWLATFSWVWTPQHDLKLSAVTSVALRTAAAFVIVGACYLGFWWSAQVFEVLLILVFGLFGVACKLFQWNRPVLILACYLGNLFEQSIRQTMMISQGDPAIFFQRESSAYLLGGTIVLIALAVVLSVKRGVRAQRFPAAH